MNEIAYEKQQEAAAFGQFLLETIAEHIGANEPTEKSISRSVYKDTACGAWVAFNAEGIQVGTIVEGSDATYDERLDLSGIDQSETGALLLCERFNAAIERCEKFAEEHFSTDDENEKG